MHNQKPTTSINRKRDRLSYLWLALGIVLLPFSMPNWTIPLAAWLIPIFLLRFVRTQPLLRGMLLLLLASALVPVFELQGVGLVNRLKVRTQMVNWLKVRTKVSVDSLCVRIFTQIFRG